MVSPREKERDKERDPLKEAIEDLYDALLENDDDFHQEGGCHRSSTPRFRTTRTATSIIGSDE